ncbi:cell wall-associated NlpC family hydrolase [Enterococcus sp. PF1-24]|uniref:NlpC/P60 family protein n=1 Tax=unclassified Enterococcus TaxID=2608891 RepID=UPI0024765BE8|nr:MULTISPECIES: NlpC/P60 family protein [unclassified Enterococcus]MDH6364564.1 cell wall-associated NlpC family hydrolase [Enterococcus sp. PFB1-1]MDH6401665.1 cell wall-associated NlpC family hydrolase [Enterococcus sp. PF1-24]
MKRKLLVCSFLLTLALGFSMEANAEEPNEELSVEAYEASGAAEAGYSYEQYVNFINMPEMEETAVAPFTMRAGLSDQQSKVLSLLQQQLGKPYDWGGNGPDRFDCSGLVVYVFQNAVGIKMDRITYQQEVQGVEVGLDNLQVGDLVFFGPRGATYHVGVYIGNNQYIHASETSVITTDMQYYKPDFARRVLNTSGGEVTPTPPATGDKVAMHRFQNINTGEHFYTSSEAEKNQLAAAGWNYEGIGWYAPTSGNKVYRVYNPNSGDHHYTLSSSEKNYLVSIGWQDEGVGWYSDVNQGVALYRAYNPYVAVGSHHYTASQAEFQNLLASGWQNEGIAWYGR